MSNKFYLGILLSIFLSTSAISQVDLSGTCVGGATVSLASAGVVNGKDAFQAMGTVLGNPVTIAVYWEPLGPGWVLAFNGQPFYIETNNTTLPNNTISGNWTALAGAPCPIADITIAGTSTLPVELTFFQGALRDGMSYLSWQTASETNNAGFEVERSFDGISWTKLGFIVGAVNSTETLNYQFVDTKPLLGINYYRLRQVDIDGAFEYSDVINIEKEKEEGTVVIFPNPAKDKLSIIGSDFINAQISIYDNLGQLVKSITSDTESVEIDIASFSKGTYTIEIRKGTFVYVEKLVKL